MKALKDTKIPYEHFSAGLAKRLFKVYPAWIQYAGYTTEGSLGEYLYYLEVSVPTENSSVAEPFVISVDLRREVTLSWFGGWHIHVLTKKDETDEHYFSRVLSAVDLIFAEEQVIAVCYRGDKGISGFSIATDSDIPTRLLPKYGEKLVIRSWRASYDREIANPNTHSPD